MKVVICANCGKKTKVSDYARCARIFCQACRKARKHYYHDKYKNKYKPKEEEVKIGGRLDELQRRAHAAGMSYGRYVAMIQTKKALTRSNTSKPKW